MSALPLHDRAGVEGIVAPEQRHQFVVVALLDFALDDHEQRVDRLACGDQVFARSVIADVDGLAQFFDLALGQAVERRIGGVEGFRHGLKTSL